MALPNTTAKLWVTPLDFRPNVYTLVEQAAASSGAADEELISQRIAAQEAKLELLTKRREELVQLKS
jgi:hypothetical protein